MIKKTDNEPGSEVKITDYLTVVAKPTAGSGCEGCIAYNKEDIWMCAQLPCKDFKTGQNYLYIKKVS